MPFFLFNCLKRKKKLQSTVLTVEAPIKALFASLARYANASKPDEVQIPVMALKTLFDEIDINSLEAQMNQLRIRDKMYVYSAITFVSGLKEIIAGLTGNDTGIIKYHATLNLELHVSKNICTINLAENKANKNIIEMMYGCLLYTASTTPRFQP